MLSSNKAVLKSETNLEEARYNAIISENRLNKNCSRPVSVSRETEI